MTGLEMDMVLTGAIAHYGPEHQKKKCVEELGELLVELARDLNGCGNRGKLADEIADVKNLLAQLEMIYGIKDMVSNAIDYKLVRLRDNVQRDMFEQHVSSR